MNRTTRACGCGIVLIACTALPGCAVGPNFHQPAAPKVDHYTLQPLPEAAATAPGAPRAFVPGKAPSATWWQGFGSPELNALVDAALRANPTMQAAEASLRQAQENVEGPARRLLPGPAGFGGSEPQP